MWEIGNLAVEQGEKIKGHLQFPSVNEQIPAILIHGHKPGPTVLVMGGIHGCEYSSIDAVLELSKNLLPTNTKGKIVFLPIANPASFYARSIYVHPEDGKNLNRVFPGNVNGTESERLAYWLNESVIKHVDYMIDLHGGDMIEALIPFTIYQITTDEKITEDGKRMASLFGIDYVIGSTNQVGGSTYGTAANQGKVAVIAEAGQQGILDANHSKLLQDGTKNALRSIGVLDGEVEEGTPHLLNVFDWYFAEQSGLWYPNVQIGEKVQKGTYLGKITDEFGETIQEYVSTTNGVVLFLVTSLAMNEKNPLLAIGE